MSADLLEFLDTVVTTPEGYLELGVRNGTYKQHWYEWPSQTNDIIDHATSAEGDVYFSAHLFKTRDSHKENVLPTRTLQQDLDNADVNKIVLQPTILNQTSPLRHQGFWVTTTEFDSLEEHEQISKRLCYSIEDCDHSGWSLGHKMRLPFTKNHKYTGHQHDVSIVLSTTKQYTIDELLLLPTIPNTSIMSDEYLSFLLTPPEKASKAVGVYELVESIKDQLSAKVYAEFMQDGPSSDRSVALFSLMCACFRAGLSRELVYHIAYASPNNKFHMDLRYNADRELVKDVLRAEQATQSPSVNVRDMINEIRRKTKSLTSERRWAIFELVKSALGYEGDFVHLNDDRRFYLPKETGRPIEVEMGSEHLHSMLDIKYGLNRTEPEHAYCINALMSHTAYLPGNNYPATVAYYDRRAKQILLHGGRKNVYSITPTGITEVPNSSYNTVFLWDHLLEPFTPDLSAGDLDWAKIMFKFPNVINMTEEEARHLLKVWVIFAILREEAASRPLLAFLGQPGCLSYKTQVNVRHGKNFYKATVEELYRKFHQIPTAGQGNYYRSGNVPTEVLSLKDGSIEYRQIADVIKSGVKQVYLVLTSNNETIRATKDHRFLTLDNQYKPLSELKVGDTILMRHEPALVHGRQEKRQQFPRKKVRVNYHPQGTKDATGGKYYPRIYQSKAVLEAAMNNLDYQEYLDIMMHDKQRAATLKFIEKGFDVHHKDGDHLNNSLDNLEVVSHSGHAREHGLETHKHHFKYFAPIEVTITGIAPVGEEETYDITMADESAPNFVANNFIVHNSGKTSAASKIYNLFYGRHVKISGATSPTSYDFATASMPFFCIDNADTWQSWLPDRLAQSAAKTDIVVRKLYTNNQTIRIKRQALVGITAHDPKFGRADVTDRMLIITLQRFSNMGIPFVDEGGLEQEVMDNRGAIWGAIIKDLQRVLATPYPASTDLQLRIQDFARMGEWISIALGSQELFREAIGSVIAAQRAFNLDEDHLLVTGVQRWLKQRTIMTPLNQDDLFSQISSLVPTEDYKTFTMLYKNSSSFCRRLSNLQDTLSNTVFTVEVSVNKKGERLWNILSLDN